MATPKKTATGRWWVQIEVAGQRESGTFDTKREADAWAQRRSTELREMKTSPTGDFKTLQQALREYADKISPTKRGGDKEIIRLNAFEGMAHQPMPLKKKVTAITSDDLTAWRDARLKVTARGSVLRDMTLLSHVFEIMRREWKWITTNPMRDVSRPQEPDHREVIIYGPQVRKMLRQLGWKGSKQPVRTVSQAVAVCFLVALMTGMRAGELCALEWGDIKEHHARLHTSKSGKGRDVPLTPTAKRTIELMRGFDDVLVFGLTAQTLDALFRRNRDRAGLEGFTFHDARHTAATVIAQKVHVLDLCKIFGWSNTKRALTYFNPKMADLAKRMAG
jgi:integrase